jgi:hypothetical protein
MRRKVSLSTVFTAQGGKQEKVGKLACCLPRESALLLYFLGILH